MSQLKSSLVKACSFLQRVRSYLFNPINQKQVAIGAALGIAIVLVLFRQSQIQPPVVGVVDMSRVYLEAAVYRDMKEKQSALEEQWRTEALAEKQALEEKDLKLSRSKRRLKKKTFDKKASDLREEILDFQNRQMARLNLISLNSAAIMREIDSKAAEIARKVADKKGLDMVVSASDVLYSNKKIDITDDFVVELNRTITEVDFKNPQDLLEQEE